MLKDESLQDCPITWVILMQKTLEFVAWKSQLTQHRIQTKIKNLLNITVPLTLKGKYIDKLLFLFFLEASGNK